MRYRIAEVAELTGVPATAIRYYEQEGILHPADRAPNGYRTYSDRDVARLRFVSRARNLDLPVADLRQLVELWDGDDCSMVAARMREQVAQRLLDTQQQIAELMALASDLEGVQARLRDTSHPGACDDQCVCLDRPPVPDGSLSVTSSLPIVEPTATQASPRIERTHA